MSSRVPLICSSASIASKNAGLTPFLIALWMVVESPLQAQDANPAERTQYEVTVALVFDRAIAIGDAGGPVYSPPITRDVLATEATILRSYEVVADAVEDSKLNDLKLFTDRNVFVVANEICTRLKVTIGGGTPETKDANILVVGFTGFNPDECRYVLDAVVDSYQDRRDRQSTSVLDDRIHLLTKAHQATTTALQETRAQYRQWREASVVSPLSHVNDRVVGPYEDRLATIRLAQYRLDIQATEIKAELSVLETRQSEGSSTESLLAVVRRRSATDSAANEPADQTSMLTQHLITARAEEVRLIAELGEKHPKVQGVRAQVEFLEYAQDNARLADSANRSLTPEQQLDEYLSSRRMEIEILEASRRSLNVEEETALKMNGIVTDLRVENDEFVARISRHEKLLEQLELQMQTASAVFVEPFRITVQESPGATVVGGPRPQ